MIEVWCELVCAECARAETGRYTREGRVPRKELIAQAKNSGWEFLGEEAFCSTECLTKHTNGVKK
jgi:hypothetical protein